VTAKAVLSAHYDTVSVRASLRTWTGISRTA